VSTAGVAAPLTVIVAFIAIALLGNTLTQWRRFCGAPLPTSATRRSASGWGRSWPTRSSGRLAQPSDNRCHRSRPERLGRTLRGR
jgi:hypothetical protein